MKYKVLQIFAVGEQVACEWKMQGTQEKPLEGLNGVGRSVELVGASLAVVRNNEIVRQIDYWDSGTMMQQLGAIG